MNLFLQGLDLGHVIRFHVFKLNHLVCELSSQIFDLSKSFSQLVLKRCNDTLKFFIFLRASLFASGERVLESADLVLALFLVVDHSRLQARHLASQILDFLLVGHLRGNALVTAFLKFLDLYIFLRNDLDLLRDLGLELLGLVT